MTLCARVVARAGDLRLDVQLRAGRQPLVLAGPNGSGKTTLLRVLAGAHPVSEGEIVVGGEVLFSARRGVDLPCERRGVGYVPQGFGLFPHLSALDNVAFGLSTGARRLSRRQRRARALQLLAELGCAELADRDTRQLSGGETQRVALARALAVGPRLLLLDEPLSALDAVARRSVRAFLAERVRAAGVPAVVVTHDVRDAAALGASICVLQRGGVVQRGSLDALRACPANDFVAEFVGAG